MGDSPPVPDYELERGLADAGFLHVCGVDEVGRGPIAGPVCAAAVILDPARLPPGIDDSKRLSHAQRLRLDRQIRETARACCVALASVQEIDDLNIRQAALLAMTRAVTGLGVAPQYVLVDGRDVPPRLTIPARAVVKGDQRVLSIAAASILAKVARDRLMTDLAVVHPGYGWEQNAGYPTPQHLHALESLGITPHHRRTFAPVRRWLPGG